MQKYIRQNSFLSATTVSDKVVTVSADRMTDTDGSRQMGHMKNWLGMRHGRYDKFYMVDTLQSSSNSRTFPRLFQVFPMDALIFIKSPSNCPSSPDLTC